MSQIPAHVRRIRRSRRNGSSRVILYEYERSAANDDWREYDAGVSGHARDPATDRREDDARGDRAIGCLDTDDAVTVAEEAGHPRVLEDVDAALRGARRVGPRDAVVPCGCGFDVVRGAEDRVAAAAGQVDLGDELLELDR